MGYPSYSATGWDKIAEEVTEELRSARTKFPRADHLTVALAEECGEAIRAIAQHREKCGCYPDHSPNERHTALMTDVRKELIQTIAMCVRLIQEGDDIENLPLEKVVT